MQFSIKSLVCKEIDTKRSLTFGLTVPEGDRSFIFGHEASSTRKAQNSAWFWLVGAQRTELAGPEAVSGKLSCGTLTCQADKTKQNKTKPCFTVSLPDWKWG